MITLAVLGVHVTAVVEGISYEAILVTQNDSSSKRQKRRTSEELVCRNFALIACGLHPLVKDNVVNVVIGCKRLVKLYCVYQGKDRLVAPVNVLGCGSEGNTCSVHCERNIGGVVILERLAQRKAGACLLKGHRSAARACGGCGAHLAYGYELLAVAFAVNVKQDLVTF